MNIQLRAGEIRHCPRCLAVLGDDDDGHQPAAPGEGEPDQLDSMRRRIRDQFVDRLARSGRVACPHCSRPLDPTQVARLRADDHFHCPGCGLDLAAHAYQQEVYGEQRWLPIIYALGDLAGDLTCARCSVLGAIAGACSDALSHIPKFLPEQHRMLGTMLARADWRPPEPACRETCVAIKQYQSTVGHPLLLL